MQGLAFRQPTRLSIDLTQPNHHNFCGMESRTPSLSHSCYLLMGSGSVLLPHLFDENSNMSPLSMILNPLLITLPCHNIAGQKDRLRYVGYPCSIMISQLLGFRRRAPDCCMWRSPPAPHKAGYESCDQKRSPSPSSRSSNSVLVSSLRQRAPRDSLRARFCLQVPSVFQISQGEFTPFYS